MPVNGGKPKSDCLKSIFNVNGWYTLDELFKQEEEIQDAAGDAAGKSVDQDGIAVGEPHADAAGKAAVHDGIALKVINNILQRFVIYCVRGRHIIKGE